MPLTFELLFRALVAAGIAVVVVPLFLAGDRRSWPSAVVAAALLYFGSTLAYGYLSNWTWPRPGETADVASGPSLADLEARTQHFPEDVNSWANLGFAYLQLGRSDDAVRALERAHTQGGGVNADIALTLIDALIAADDANRPRVNQMVEALLKRAPDHPRALLYGAELAFSRREYSTAKARWQRLLARAELEDTEHARSVAEVLRKRISLANQHAGLGTTAPASEPSIDSSDQTGPGVTVAVDIEPEMRGRYPATTPVFVLARAPGARGPPLAVVRRSAGELPFEVRLSDRDAMLPTLVLSSAETVEIVARVAAGGSPVAQSGDLYGAVTTRRGEHDRVRITISEVYP